MQHRNARAFLLASLGLVLAAGCDTIEINHHAKLEARATNLAEAYCAAYQACDCTPLGTDAVHDDPEECVSKEKARLLSAFEKAEDEDLEFDSDCMDQLVSHYQSLDCGSIPSFYSAFGYPTALENFGCALYHGDEVDGVCADVDGTSWSDCASGSLCRDDNQCTMRSPLGGQGDSCAFSGLSGFSLDCQPGLYCDQFDGCQPAGTLGDPCLIAGDGSGQCASDHWCEPLGPDTAEGICQARLQAGEPCTVGSGNDPCHGRCEPSPDSQDPAIGACMDVPAICLYEDLRPPV